MKREREFRPDLNECMLEGRIAPAIPNLGTIVQTTNGLVLSTPFPGAVNIGSLGGGPTSTGTAASVSGAAFPTSIYVTGTHGISTFMPGNFTGNLSLAGLTGTTAQVHEVVAVGSGADVASTPTTPTVTRNTVGMGTPNPVLAFIGPAPLGSGSGGLPAGKSGSDAMPTTPAPQAQAPQPGSQTPGSPMTPTGAPSPLSDPLKSQNSSLGGQNRLPLIGVGGTGSATPSGGNTFAPTIPSPSGGPRVRTVNP
jgi:hypothetical protein